MIFKAKEKYPVLDDFFTVLGNRQRVRILQYLNQEGAKCVGEISRKLGIEQSAVSHNMRRLLACHFVYVEHVGKERVYTINQETVQPLFDLIGEHVQKYCAKACKHWE